MNNTTQNNLVKCAFIIVGFITIALGGLTFHIADVVGHTKYLSSMEDFFYSFLTVGSRPIWLYQIRQFGYIWLVFGTLYIFTGFFLVSFLSSLDNKRAANFVPNKKKVTKRTTKRAPKPTTFTKLIDSFVETPKK